MLRTGPVGWLRMPVVWLRHARELFEQPERTPLDPDYEPWCVVPAAEHLIQVIRSSRAHLVVEVPGANEARAALARYSTARAEELSREVATEVKRALWALIPTGAVFAIISLALSRWASSSSSDWLSGAIAEALVVIGWVVLWARIPILGTDLWILLGRRRAYRRLVSEQVEIRSG